MSGTYRKEGTTARVTSLRGVVFESTTRESGVAGFRGGRFFSASAEPAGSPGTPRIDDARALHDRVVDAAVSLVAIERLRAVCGASAHRFEPEEGDARSWTDSLALVHATVSARSGMRVSVLRGGPSADSIDAAEIRAIAGALAAAGETRPIDADEALVLAPAVSAAIAAEMGRDPRLAEHVPIAQATHPDYGVDGLGMPIAAAFASGSSPAEWPNVFRPSYRSPAVPALMHVELAVREARAGSRDPMEAIELLRPPHADRNWLELEALWLRGDETFAGSIRLPLARLAEATVEGERSWYPFHAGAWGRRTRV